MKSQLDSSVGNTSTWTTTTIRRSTTGTGGVAEGLFLSAAELLQQAAVDDHQSRSREALVSSTTRTWATTAMDPAQEDVVEAERRAIDHSLTMRPTATGGEVPASLPVMPFSDTNHEAASTTTDVSVIKLSPGLRASVTLPPGPPPMSTTTFSTDASLADCLAQKFLGALEAKYIEGNLQDMEVFYKHYPVSASMRRTLNALEDHLQTATSRQEYLVSLAMAWKVRPSLGQGSTPCEHRQATEFFVDNHLLHSTAKGVAYRLSKNFDDTGAGSKPTVVQWGTFVRGVDDDDGWVQVNDLFLPKKVIGIPVLVPKKQMTDALVASAQRHGGTALVSAPTAVIPAEAAVGRRMSS